MINIGMRNKPFFELKNSKSKQTRRKSSPINKGSDINPENVSTKRGDTAMRIDEKKPAGRLLDALYSRRPTTKMLNEKKMILIHLAVERKSP